MAAAILAGLSGEAIAEEARIVAICDAFDAMTHRRPWRSDPMSIQAALSELKRGAGRQFDAQFVTHSSISFGASSGSTRTSTHFWPKVLTNSNTFERARGWKRSSRAADGAARMMVAVFATMSLALICGWVGRRSLAVALFVFVPCAVDRALPV